MQEGLHGDWVVAIATIVAAIIGLIGVAAGSYFERQKASIKAIQFIVYEPQTITGDLEGHGREFKVMLGDQITSELNVSLVQVTNDGTEPIENLTFDITIPGERKILLADCMSPASLKNAVVISFSDTIPQTNPVFNVRLAFFNPGESFHVKTLVDGPAAAASVSCRMPGTDVEIIEDRDRWRDLYETPPLYLIILRWLGRAVALAFIVYLLFYQLPKYRFFLKQTPTDVIEQELKDRKPPPAAETK